MKASTYKSSDQEMVQFYGSINIIIDGEKTNYSISVDNFNARKYGKFSVRKIEIRKNEKG